MPEHRDGLYDDCGHEHGEALPRPERAGMDVHEAFDVLPPELQSVAKRYAAQPVPRPTPEQTSRLLSRLLAEDLAPVAPRRAPSVMLALGVARWRMRLLGPWFWVASVVLMALGAAISLVNAATGNVLALILLLPLTGVLSVAYAARTSSSGLREVEAAAPVGVVEVTAGLALALLGFDCAFGLLATLLLALIHWAPFVALLAAWLGPLLLLTALSVPLALRFGLGAALGLGAGPWVALALAAHLWPDGFPALFFALPAGPLSLALHLAAAVLGACLLALLLVRGGAWQHALIAVAAPASA